MFFTGETYFARSRKTLSAYILVVPTVISDSQNLAPALINCFFPEQLHDWWSSSIFFLVNMTPE
uniref:Uncharacterized protein n=1 Tax=Anguilla anguilla TaxID=7936 RepID=A0A0E9X1U2_ANGAN